MFLWLSNMLGHSTHDMALKKYARFIIRDVLK